MKKLLLATLLVLMPITAQARLAPPQSFKQCHLAGAGGYAACVATGTAHRVLHLYVKVSFSPKTKSATVYWSDVCTSGTGAASRSGHFTTKAGVQHLIPKAYYRADSCSLSAEAAGSVSGTEYLLVSHW